MTIVGSAPMPESPGVPPPKAMTTRIFHWGPDNKSPAGAPVPPDTTAHAELLPVATTAPAAPLHPAMTVPAAPLSSATTATEASPPPVLGRPTPLAR
jgi:hypothetical protein